MTVKDVFKASRVLASISETCDKLNTTNGLVLNTAIKKLNAVSHFLNENPLFSSLEEEVRTLAGRIGHRRTELAIQEIKDGVENVKKKIESGALPSGNELKGLKQKIGNLRQEAALERGERRELDLAKKYLKMVEGLNAKSTAPKTTLAFESLETFSLRLLGEFDPEARDLYAMDIYELVGALIEEDLKKFFTIYNNLPRELQSALTQEVHRRGGDFCNLACGRDIHSVREQAEKMMLSALSLVFFLANNGVLMDDEDLGKELAMAKEDLTHIQEVEDLDNQVDHLQINNL